MADDQMLNEHRRTYEGFARAGFVSAGLILLILALMAIFLL
jgi:tetrahydromethanopterin S-methyltransferase subunit F